MDTEDFADLMAIATGLTTKEYCLSLAALRNDEIDIYYCATTPEQLLFKSLAGKDVKRLWHLANYLCLSQKISEKLNMQLNIDETLRAMFPDGFKKNDPKFWLALDHLEGFRDTFDNGCPYYYCHIAARYGSLKCLQLAWSRGCPRNAQVCEAAAQGGHLNCLKWLRANGCPWDQWTCNEAARQGHLECLQWAQTNGCPCNHVAMRRAIEGQQIDSMQWIYEHSSTRLWTESILTAAIQSGNLEIFRYIIKKGCPWNPKKCLKISRGPISHWIKEYLKHARERKRKCKFRGKVH